MRIAAGIISYDDWPSIKRTIDSVWDGVNLIFIIEGKYPSYPAGPTNTDLYKDMTKKFVEKNGKNKIIYMEYPVEQVQKRNMYLQLAKDCNCECLLVIDSDEYIKPGADWELFKKDIQQLVIDPTYPAGSRNNIQHIRYEFEPKKFGILPRLFYKPWELQYINHWVLTLANDVYTQVRPGLNIPLQGITMATDDLLRDSRHLEFDAEYQWDLMLKEGILTPYDHQDPVKRKKFRDHLIYELEVWK